MTPDDMARVGAQRAKVLWVTLKLRMFMKTLHVMDLEVGGPVACPAGRELLEMFGASLPPATPPRSGLDRLRES
jgi:hypothetical protein